MALLIRYYDIVDTGTIVPLGTNDSLYIAQGATIGATTGAAVSATGIGQGVTVAGEAFGDSWGLYMGNYGTDGLYAVHVTDTGIIGASIGDAILLQAYGCRVENHGTIAGGSTGISFASDQFYSPGPTTSRLTNFGTISGEYAVFQVYNEPVVVINHGLIVGSSFSFLSGSFTGEGYLYAADIIRNRGTMIGDISFGDLNDLYDGRGGEVVGTVRGNGGEDRFIPGQAEDVFDGGLGNDTLDFSSTAGVIVSLLDDLAATGSAQGDTYVSIENITGSRQGVDVLQGNTENNLLVGLGGGDRLQGDGGTDTLVGGKGIDTLFGGAAADRFQFNTVTEAGDRIEDFISGAGTWDLIRIKASGFGGGLVAGTLSPGRFETGGDNVTASTQVRFIFRTTDKSLWFDADGVGGTGPVLVADLQSSATLTANDIVIF